MTDVQRDVDTALACVGKLNDDFKNIWEQFAVGWDGAPCSEIACCISYMAGNLSTIWVSNYAEGLVDLFKSNDRFGTEPELGAFVWFQYGDGVPSHTGRVVGVSDDMITTVEGNIDNKVVTRYCYKDSEYIYGYGYPLYTDVEETITPEEFIANAIKDIELYKGVSGYQHLILMVQKYLKDLGYYLGTIDGDFGSFTETAVIKYQRTHNLAVDGWIGKFTWEAMLND